MSGRIVHRARWVPALVALAALAACSPGAGPAAASTTATTTAASGTVSPTGMEMPSGHDHDTGGGAVRPEDRAAAQLSTAAFQDVSAAEAAGYASTLGTLGCFQDPAAGGMGVHYLDESSLDGTVELTHPEALVYELDAQGAIAGLVAHEYIVPVDAWTAAEPPALLGTSFHRHPSLPLWVLHTWIWKDNARGEFADWNPAVRLCPAGVPIFGRDLPEPAPASTGG